MLSSLQSSFSGGEFMRDKIVGRPIRLNQKTLKLDKGKQYASVVFIGDVHCGSPQFDQKKFLDILDYCYKNNLYVLLMGDLVEIGTKDSVGAGVYEQEYPGQSQYEKMVEWLYPLAQKKLILGLHHGNHEERVYKVSGINISKMMARELGVSYLGDACWSKFKVGNIIYHIYSLHGRTGARFEGTALLALERISANFFCDVVAMGHAHKSISSAVLMQRVIGNQVIEHRKHLIITGSYLKYDDSYAQASGMPISKLGSPKVKFSTKERDVHISW